MENSRNQIITSGRIMAIWEKNGANFIKLLTRQPGESRKREDGAITPVFVYKGQLPDFVTERARVEIEGYVSEYNLRNAHGAWIKGQRFAATKINLRQTQCMKEFGIPGEFYETPSITVKLQGRVKNIIEDGDWIRYLIRTKTENGEHDVKAHMKRINACSRINEGDKICCVCTVYTPKSRDGKTTYEDIIISDIAKEE